MRPDVIYAPADELYPFVDMLWVEDLPQEREAQQEQQQQARTVYTIQSTVGPTHSKSFKTYLKLRRRLEMAANDRLVVYIGTINKMVQTFRDAPSSTFWKNLSIDAAERQRHVAMKLVEFRVLTPPPRHGNSKPLLEDSVVSDA